MKIKIGNLEFIHPLLREIVLWAESEFGEGAVSSLYRPGDPGVHGQIPLRGIDWSDPGKVKAKRIVDAVNKRWQYDPNRPELQCCIYHKNRWSDGMHIHFQMHPNTVRR